MDKHPVVWHGTDAQFDRLRAAVAHACPYGETCGGLDAHGQPVPQCGPHAMLGDQHALDRLAFVATDEAAHGTYQWGENHTAWWEDIAPAA